MWSMPQLLASERQRFIMRKIASEGSVKTLELSRALRVSMESVRRDLMALEERGLVKRVYGGAVAPSANRGSEPPFRQRLSINAAAKMRIGKIAAKLASSAQSIFVDVGTTASGVAEALASDARATVVTHSLLVAQALAESPYSEVLLAPGRLRPGEWSVTGSSTLEFLSHMHFDIAFLSCGGVDGISGATDFNLDDVRIKQTIARNSKQAFVLADATKHLVVGTYDIASWFDLSGLITDQEPPEGLVTAIRNSGGVIHI